MNVRFKVALLCSLATMVIAGNATAQCDDPYDKVLCVSTLNDAQAAQFSSTDQRVSDFWSDWGGKDFADMISPDFCYPGRCGFNGSDDAAMKIKAAATRRGIYVYIEITDNVWTDRATADDIGADATDLFFDRHGSDYLFACEDCLIGLYGTMLSFTTNQFQVWMGASNPPTGFMYQQYDENAWSWQSTGYTWAAARALLGFEVEVVTIDATHKAQEWYFPWDKFGSVGVPDGTNLAGTKLGFAGGYNDKDGDNPEMDCLRWTLRDPWAAKVEGNYWGDMLIGSDLPPVQLAGIGVRDNGRQISVQGAAASSVSYNLRGQRIADQSHAAQARNGIVVRAGAHGHAVAGIAR